MRLVLEYDGTDFHGWQRQPDRRTVAGELLRAIERICREQPRITAAGRTDAGAHSHGQVVGLRLQEVWAPAPLQAALNAVLPPDVVVREAALVEEGFHARRDAAQRTYRYLVAGRSPRAPLLRRYAWTVDTELNVSEMRAAAAQLRGRHDFGAFGRPPRPGGSTVRTVQAIDVRMARALADERLPVCIIEVSADAFLRGMMRGIAGALVAVGRGRLASIAVAGILEREGGVAAIPVAPSRGLHQWAVHYPRPVGDPVETEA